MASGRETKFLDGDSKPTSASCIDMQRKTDDSVADLIRLFDHNFESLASCTEIAAFL
jgi:hypothetical protein